MLITLTRGQFFESLFPEAPASAEALTSFLRQRYSVGAYTPEITIEGDLSHIHIDEAEVARTNDDYNRIVRLAEKGKYDEAKKLIVDAIHKGTAISDIYCVHDKILFDRSEFDALFDESSRSQMETENTSYQTRMGRAILKRHFVTK